MLFVCSAKLTDLKTAICYNAIYQIPEDEMTAREYKRWKYLDDHYDELTEDEREEHAILSTKLGG